MAAGKQTDHSIIAALARAIELSDEALAQVARSMVEGIRFGLPASSHVEAAERDMRSALRQLVLAERELRSRPGLGPRLERQPERIAEVLPGPAPAEHAAADAASSRRPRRAHSDLDNAR
jgi:hypothetical protein